MFNLETYRFLLLYLGFGLNRFYWVTTTYYKPLFTRHYDAVIHNMNVEHNKLRAYKRVHYYKQ